MARRLTRTLGVLTILAGLLLVVMGGLPLVQALISSESRAYYLFFAVVLLPPGLAGVTAGLWMLRRGGPPERR